MTKPLISVVVILKQICDFNITRTFPAIYNQTYKNWELLILPDHSSTFRGRNTKVVPTFPKLGPADKKDLGIEKAKGEIIAFIDDDAYPDKNWLKNSLAYFNNIQVAAVCGPGVTPPSDSLLSQVSGWFWASPLGSGGAGTYRCWPGRVQEVDDYPSCNLVVRKKDIGDVGGFDSGYWPGEDTKLCHDLVYKLNKKIIYDPKVLVYHQRRPIFAAHLKQIGRYGLHRGHFVRILPRTSKRLGYFGPAVFAIGFIAGAFILALSFFVNNNLAARYQSTYLTCVLIYFFVDVINSIWVLFKSRSVAVFFLLIPTVFISHVFYGLMFTKGLMMEKLVSKYDRNKL